MPSIDVYTTLSATLDLSDFIEVLPAGSQGDANRQGRVVESSHIVRTRCFRQVRSDSATKHDHVLKRGRESLVDLVAFDRF